MKDGSVDRKVAVEVSGIEYASEMAHLEAIAEMVAEYMVNKYGEKGSN